MQFGLPEWTVLAVVAERPVHGSDRLLRWRDASTAAVLAFLDHLSAEDSRLPS